MKQNVYQNGDLNGKARFRRMKAGEVLRADDYLNSQCNPIDQGWCSAKELRSIGTVVGSLRWAWCYRRIHHKA
jgi:hypothetical protein